MAEKIKKTTIKATHLILALLVCAATAIVSNLKSDGTSPNQSNTPKPANSGSERNPVSQDDLCHGNFQVQMMVEQRPAMSRYVKRGDKIWQWAARQFAGEGSGLRIYWDSSPPPKGVRAQNKCVGLRHTIRISASEENGNPLNGEELWASAVFELYNTRILYRWAMNDADAKAGKISKQEWMRTAQYLEFQSGASTKAFYFSVWIPHLKKLGVAADLSAMRAWNADAADSFEEYLTQSSDYSEYLRH